jgi:tRNA(Ile)-lysidine synthase
MDADGVVEAVVAGGLVAADRPVVVMLSGGRDSVCLLDVCARVCGPRAVLALHVNYGLRDGAGADQEHCEALCSRLGIRLHEERAPKWPASGNLQAGAREVRYDAARRLAGEWGGAVIAVGHTATDQVETILYRLASSPSRRALLGMRPADGSLVRPLLSYTREQTAAYCRARGLAWREDASNEGEEFARSRIRNGLVPALREVHPAAEANVLAVASVLREEAVVLDGLVEDVLAGRDEVPLEELRALPEALARLVLQRLADDAAGGFAPGTARRCREVLALGPNASLDLPHGVRALARRGLLHFEGPYNRSA